MTAGMNGRSSRTEDERNEIEADNCCGLTGDDGARLPEPKSGTRSLAELETIITRGRQTYIEVGEALREIRTRRLYKERYKTFEIYCRKMWGFTRSSAYDYMKAATVGRALQNEGKEAPTSLRGGLSLVEPKPTVTADAEQDDDDQLAAGLDNAVPPPPSKPEPKVFEQPNGTARRFAEQLAELGYSAQFARTDAGEGVSSHAGHGLNLTLLGLSIKQVDHIVKSLSAYGDKKLSEIAGEALDRAVQRVASGGKLYFS